MENNNSLNTFIETIRTSFSIFCKDSKDEWVNSEDEFRRIKRNILCKLCCLRGSEGHSENKIQYLTVSPS